MDICQALNTYLGSIDYITSIVGSRIFPEILPQDCPLPAIVYSPVYASYDSELLHDSGFVRQTVQIVCHAQTFKKARDLSRLVKKALQDFHGQMAGLFIQAVFIKTDYMIGGNTALKFDTDEYMASIEFEFLFNEEK